ncbi:MAG: hypothetical protein M1822_001757 [Bathelium mastoideum]|nr:MAG: hypothetical protein M1822_001757 [Bathelium mastoideum]
MDKQDADFYDQILKACSTKRPSELDSLLARQDEIVLQAVAEAGDADMAKYILDRKSAVIDPEQSLLGAAAMHNNTAIFRYILERTPSLLTKQKTGLQAFEGGVDIWKVILQLNHSLVNWEFGHSGNTVGFAVQRGDPSLLDFFLSEGADVEHSHVAYKPVLPFAKDIGASQEVIDLLLKYGATMKKSIWDED